MNKSDYSVRFFYSKEEEPKVTVALLTVHSTGEVFKGISRLNPNDKFNREIGEKIAEARARKRYYKSEAKEAFNQYQDSRSWANNMKLIAEKKFNRLAREEKWLSEYLKKI